MSKTTTEFEQRVQAAITKGKANQPTPIADEAFALISANETPLIERLPKIYALADKAHKAGGDEREHASWITDNLYASASEDEFLIIKQFEESLA